MTELAAMPGWLEYDIRSWTQMLNRAEWRHYIATTSSLTAAIDVLEKTGFSDGKYNCESSGKASDGTPKKLDVSIEYDLPIRDVFPALLQARQRGDIQCNFTSLPARVLWGFGI